MSEDTLGKLEQVIARRMKDYRAGKMTAEQSRVVKALTGPEEQLLRKIPEEAVEVVLAHTHSGNVAAEAADLLFHAMLLLHKAGVPLADVMAELSARLPDKGNPAQK